MKETAAFYVVSFIFFSYICGNYSIALYEKTISFLLLIHDARSMCHDDIIPVLRR